MQLPLDDPMIRNFLPNYMYIGYVRLHIGYNDHLVIDVRICLSW